MLTLDVNTDDTSVRELLAAVSATVSPESCATVVAEAGADTVRAHFVKLSRARHRPAQRINFYLQASDSVIRETNGTEALIKIPHTGIAQRYYGGTIKPSGRPSKITGQPITRLAVGLSGTPGEGHVPADFNDLFLIVKKKQGNDKGAAFLARRSQSGIQVLFVLLTQVRQAADTTILPTNSELLDNAAEAILDLYTAAVERQQ